MASIPAKMPAEIFAAFLGFACAAKIRLSIQ
jgi:hypothetical protein